EHLRSETVLQHQIANISGNGHFVWLRRSQRATPFGQALSFFFDAKIDIVRDIVDHPAEGIETGNVPPPFAVQRNERQGQIRFTGASNSSGVHKGWLSI